MSDTAAHEYAREGNIDALNEYISSNPNDINSKDWDRYTPLHNAAEKGHTEIASLLISNGADISSKDRVSILVYICNYMIYHQY